MKFFRTWAITASVALGSLLSACGGGSSDPSPPVVPTPDIFATVSGTVRDAAGAAADGVHVTFGSNTVDTDANGNYSFTLRNTSTDTVLSFTKTGYAKQTRKAQSLATTTLQSGDATINPIGLSQTFDPTATVTLSVQDSTAQVTLPAGALVRSNGSSPTGPAKAELTVIDPSVNTSAMPGGFATATGFIESNGALQVDFVDADGTKLQLASGKTATIRIPAVQRSGSLPATTPLYYLDEATGLWVQEGSATLQGTAPDQYYEGSVNHFTPWNADNPLDLVYINGCVQESGGARAGANVLVPAVGVNYIFKGAALTDASGNFRVAVRKNSINRLYAQSVLPERFGPTVDVTVGTTDVTMPSCLALSTDGWAPVIEFDPVPLLPPPGPTPVGDYAGDYSGAYAGKDAGTFSVVIGTSGVVAGTGHSTTYNVDFVVSGEVAAGGSLSLTSTTGTAGGAYFTGSINVATGALTGTWRYPTTPAGASDGTFAGTRR